MGSMFTIHVPVTDMGIDTTVPATAIEALREDEVLSVRPLAHTESLDRR